MEGQTRTRSRYSGDDRLGPGQYRHVEAATSRLHSQTLMSGKRILVTGGFGYVGSRLTPHLLALGHHVRVIDLLLYTDAGLTALRNMPGYPEWSSRFELVQGTIRDEVAVRSALKDID